ncbi:GNAT family N-acetyltransferase [Nocardioides sp. CPCC 205120]|uniref:GNAT family N-acetyltransferase n=1 Tax=Nocardioides sp. CPCC 205120 TaxID=3406462 RepID=UPI003B512D9B
MTTFRPATGSDVPAAARLLARAFHDYPWTRWSVPVEGYAERLEHLQAAYLGHAVAHGVVLVDDDVRAVLALLPPDTPPPAAEVQDRVAELLGDRLPAVAGAALPSRPDGAWDLATLGVDPAHRGRGTATALLAAGLAVVDADPAGAVVALETSDERNVRLYERVGFAVTARTVVPEGPLVVSMTRPAPAGTDAPAAGRHLG